MGIVLADGYSDLTETQNRSVYRVGHQPFSTGLGNCSGFMLTVKVPEVMLHPVSLNAGLPLLLTFSPRDAAIYGSTGLARAVLTTFRERRDTQIAAAVVEFVTVDVVAFARVTIYESEKVTVKTDFSSSAANRFLTDGISQLERPSPLADLFSISRINDGAPLEAAVLGTQINVGCAIWAKGDRARGKTRPVTTKATEHTLALFDYGRSCEKSGAALLAGARNGRLTGHQASPWCQTPAVDAVRGHFASSNYTSYQIGGT